MKKEKFEIYRKKNDYYNHLVYLGFFSDNKYQGFGISFYFCYENKIKYTPDISMKRNIMVKEKNL